MCLFNFVCCILLGTTVFVSFTPSSPEGTTGEIYNIGTDFETSNVQVAKKLIAAHGLSHRVCAFVSVPPQVFFSFCQPIPRSLARPCSLPQEAELITFTRDRAINDTRYKMDNTKIQRLGWYDARRVPTVLRFFVFVFSRCHSPHTRTHRLSHHRTPLVDWDEGIKRTVEWYRQNAGERLAFFFSLFSFLFFSHRTRLPHRRSHYGVQATGASSSRTCRRIRRSQSRDVDTLCVRRRSATHRAANLRE